MSLRRTIVEIEYPKNRIFIEMLSKQPKTGSQVANISAICKIFGNYYKVFGNYYWVFGNYSKGTDGVQPYI